ncbi:MAG: sialate O-acetylesterase, partial [Phycisphaerae bacterium]|nr:sialate O-acetylesterase [Phycisphaerae bacterium]MDW8263512.1 hypothetical protein [Phycisphaerales bacterium]
MRFRFVAGMALMILVAGTRAEVSPARLFTDHMVIQRGARVPVWGTADSGEEVTVSIAGQTRSTRADAEGRWRVDLEPIE